MIRLFQVYYPVRTLVLLGGELLLLVASFISATVIRLGPDSELTLRYENGLAKLLIVSILAIISAYYFDLYSPQNLRSKNETYFRLLLLFGTMCLVLSAVGYFFPEFFFGRGIFTLGMIIATISVLCWRGLYVWLLRKPFLREQVYVLGSGPKAGRFVDAIRDRTDLGMDIIGWTGASNSLESMESLTTAINNLSDGRVQRVVVAVSERRATLPVREMLDLRLKGVKIEDSTLLLEKISGKIDVDDLRPSAMIFSEGFKVNEGMLVMRRAVSILASLILLLCFAPLLPFIVLAIKLTSPGPVLFSQNRVGKNGRIFKLYKFRTMRQDAEAGTGAVWAQQNDPRITTVGRFLRKTRLDEIPQLWNVLKGDMGFVGPRPERPEFVQWLVDAIPYYNLRHIIRPGITGWAQTKYQYGASLEETQQKLSYDLYYIKHISVMLDLMIIFGTIKTVILRRGAQ
ncbi:MAG: TIGR03013 family PEP-CTERM/XrtA system glycosyltransferase [Terriglobia bacterium]|jgi:sugar transferase (PEP-CTERM system associated)|nr:TIGR03013 family PEP-CTERM/XrtA system glycosyltransferase [Terriglobia bacterium]